MARMFHVTSRRNRGSIRSYGLDWTRMTAVPGIAGSTEAEQAGCFLCRDDHEVEFFLRFTGPGDPLDVWAVDDVNEFDLIESPEGFQYVPYRIPPAKLTLVRTDVHPTA
jgi:hypothetical protein